MQTMSFSIFHWSHWPEGLFVCFGMLPVTWTMATCRGGVCFFLQSFRHGFSRMRSKIRFITSCLGSIKTAWWDQFEDSWHGTTYFFCEPGGESHLQCPVQQQHLQSTAAINEPRKVNSIISLLKASKIRTDFYRNAKHFGIFSYLHFISFDSSNICWSTAQWSPHWLHLWRHGWERLSLSARGGKDLATEKGWGPRPGRNVRWCQFWTFHELPRKEKHKSLEVVRSQR